MSTSESSAARSPGLAALVTGAASGMGRATAEVFAAEGAHVALTDIAAEVVPEVADDLVHRGLSAEAWTLDVSDPAAIQAVVAAAAARFGGLDMVVNNAGISAFASIDFDGYEHVWGRAFDILITAQQRIVRAALPHLRKSAHPRIVNIASTEALGATSRDTPYAAAKAAVAGLTRALAVELGRKGSPSTASARRFRRSAPFRFLQVRQCRGGDGHVAGADEVR